MNNISLKMRLPIHFDDSRLHSYFHFFSITIDLKAWLIYKIVSFETTTSNHFKLHTLIYNDIPTWSYFLPERQDNLLRNQPVRYQVSMKFASRHINNDLCNVINLLLKMQTIIYLNI